jgi:hypothetical protein
MVSPTGRPRTAKSRPRTQGRRQLLVALDPALIKAVKLQAVERDTSASAIVEEALAKFLKPRAGKKRTS